MDGIPFVFVCANDLPIVVTWQWAGQESGCVHIDTSSVRSVRVACEFHSYEQFLCRSCFYPTRIKWTTPESSLSIGESNDVTIRPPNR